jgi:hypothetical protein
MILVVEFIYSRTMIMNSKASFEMEKIILSVFLVKVNYFSHVIFI